MIEPENKPSSESLAATIVAYRTLGFLKDEARAAMVELARREAEGDEFNYEAWIEEKIQDVPKSDLNPEVLNTISSIASIGSIAKSTTPILGHG